jgi:hypothetical protein
MFLPLDVIRESINERRQLQFDYRGLLRVVESMALGIGHKDEWQLRAQQVGGLSSSGKVDDGSPKLFDVALMSGAAVLATSFDIPPSYKSGDRAFVRIDTEL